MLFIYRFTLNMDDHKEKGLNIIKMEKLLENIILKKEKKKDVR